MIPISISSKRLSLLIRWAFLLAGLILMIGSTLVLPEKLGTLHLAEIVTNLGAFFVATIAVQWAFDEKMRREFMEDIAIHVLGNANVAKSGISDYVQDTKEINYSDLIHKSDRLVIGLHYSPRFVEENFRLLQERASGFKRTTILLSDQKEALQFLTSVRGETDHVIPSIKKIENLLAQINKNSRSSITVLRHNAVLRYAFVLGDEQIWIKPYRNSFGIVRPPGLQIDQGSPLFEFYEQDVNQLIAEARHD